MEKRNRIAASMLCLLVFPILLAGAANGTGPGSGAPALAKTSFLPGDEHVTVLTISEPGTVILRCKSALGASLRIEDRMTGTIQESGRAGERDGRIDLTLDIGEYRITVRRGAGDSGAIALEAIPVRERNTPAEKGTLLALLPGETWSTTLSDEECRSFWVRYEADGAPLAVAAAGRNLRTVQIWKDGQLLIQAAPFETTIEPEEGRSLMYKEIDLAKVSNPQLPAGDYLVVFIGGPPTPWERDERKEPLHIRVNARNIGIAWAGSVSIGPFGFEEYICEGEVCAEIIPTPAAEAPGVRKICGGPYPESDPGSKWRDSSDSEWDEYDNPIPGITLFHSRSWIRVHGASGASGELRVFPASSAVYPGDGEPFLATAIPSTAQLDSLDMTGLFANEDRVIAERSVELSGKSPIIRETGIFSAQSMLVRVRERGVYRIFEDETAGGSAEYSFTRVGQGTDPIYGGEDRSFALEADLYLLSVEMYEDEGLLRFAVIKSGFLSFAEIRAKGFFAKNVAPPSEGFTIVAGSYDPSRDHFVALGSSDSSILAGIALYRLPLDGHSPVMIHLNAGESVEIPALDAASWRARSARGRTTVSTAAGTSGSQGTKKMGILTVKNTGTAPDFVMLEQKATAGGAGSSGGRTQIPAPASLLQTLPRIESGKPIYADFARNQSREFLVSVTDPGFYVLETTGRLKTTLTVRTFVRPSLFTGSSGGSGRNARVVAYLQKGIYIAQAAATGPSAGRTGLRFAPVPEIDAGTLVPGQILRSSVPAGTGLSFTLSVPDTGTLSVRAESLGASHRMRITDQEGWLVAQGSEISREFAGPGNYHVFTLPSDSSHRRRIRIVQIPPKTKFPNPEEETVSLPFGVPFKGTWNERDPREPHLFSFTVPSAAEFSLELSSEMRYTLTRGGEEISEGNGGGPLSLEAGEYILALTAREKENGRRYTLSLRTTWLMPGVPQTTGSSSGTIQVSIPEEGNYDIESLSSQDLSARLFDSEGNLVASSDDRRFDWDFSISTFISPGVYTLAYARIYGGGGPAEISVVPRKVRDIGSVPLPLDRTWTARREVLRLSFRPEKTGVYAISARNPAVDKVDLLRGGILLASGLERISIPLEQGKEYTLLIPVTSTADAKIPVSVTFLQATAWNLSTTPRIEGSGPFSLSGANRFAYSFTGNGTVLYSPGMEKPLEDAGRHPRGIPQEGGWAVLVDDGGGLNAGTITAASATVDGGGFSTLIGNGFSGFRCTGSAEAVTVCSVSTQNAVAGIALSAAAVPVDPSAEAFSWVHGESVAAFCSGGNLTGTIWNTDPEAQEIAAGVTAERYPVELSLPCNPDTTIQLPPGSAVRIASSGSPVSVSLLLSAGVIFVDQAKTSSRSFWDPDRNREEVTTLTGHEFYAVNTTSSAGLVRIKPSAPRIIEDLDANETWTGVLPAPAYGTSAGETRIKVATGSAHIVFGEELSEPPVLFGSDGTIRTASELETGAYRVAGSPGILLLRGKGLVRIQRQSQESPWDQLIASPDRNRFERWKKRTDASWTEGLPVLKPGRNVGEGWFLLTPSSPALVSLRTENGGYLALYGGKRVHAYRAGGIGLTAYLDTEPILVYWKPQPGSRDLILEQRIPVDFPKDREWLFLGAGEEAVFRFSVAEESAVGVAVRAEGEILEIELYDRSFTRLASGPLFYRVLAPGEYVAVIRGADRPVRYMPLLYGNEGTRQDVPEEITRSYKEE